MLHDILVQPLINLLVSIYAVLPGHDFGIAIVVFTILVRFALWPLVRKQIHQQKALRELQPEIAKIRASSKGDKQKEGLLIMELYREREINPFASLGLIIIQFPILIALFVALRTILTDDKIVQETYSFVKELGYMKQVITNPDLFDPHLFGFVHLNQPYIPLAFAAAASQYIQTKQLMPKPKERKRLRDVLRRTAKSGDNSEALAVMNQGMGSFFAVIMFFAAATLPSALALYWTVGSLVAIFQQRAVLQRGVVEAEESVPAVKTEVRMIDERTATKKTRKKATSRKKKR